MLPYGFDDDEPTRLLLRTRPPRQALGWAGAALGATVRAVRPLRGGLASAVHLLTLTTSGGATARAVLRRYVRPDLNAEEPDLAEREGRALRYVEQLDLPTPRLLALDPTGADAGFPAVLMTALPGRVRWTPRRPGAWLRGLAALLPPIHMGRPVPPAGVIRPFAVYDQDSYEPPGWARRSAVWTRAVEIAAGPVPNGPMTLIHRDFHPGNVLWQRGSVTGVVDWASATVGPPGIDVGHCRVNLWRYGAEVADAFARSWEAVSGTAYDPWCDVASVVGCLDELRDDPPPDPHVVEDALARAVAELSGR